MSKTKNRNPPGPKFLFPPPTYLEVQRDPVGFMSRIRREYGDIVRFKIRPRADYLISHPDAIARILIAGEERMARSTPPPLKRVLGNGLLTSQGDFHRRQRKLLQPAFHRCEIAQLAAAMSDCARETSQNWQAGETIDICEEMKHITMDIVVRTLFGSEIDREKNEIAEALDCVQDMMNKNDVPFIGGILSKLPLPRNRRFNKALKRLDETIYRLIREAEEETFTPAVFLSLLLQLKQNPDTAEMFTPKQVRDEAMTMFAAGHETISNALTWTWYLLSQHPGIYDKLTAELDQVLAGAEPGMDDLRRMPYTRAVFQESIRLYPPVWVIGRRPVSDFEIDGYIIPAGSYIHISPYLVQRDERFFDQPDEFRPERWLNDAAAGRPKFSYFPFGGGTRLCIGEEFAWTEGMLVIGALAQKWNFALAPGQRIEPEMCITLRPRYGIKMKLTSRKSEEKSCPPHLLEKSQ